MPLHRYAEHQRTEECAGELDNTVLESCIPESHDMFHVFDKATGFSMVKLTHHTLQVEHSKPKGGLDKSAKWD